MADYTYADDGKLHCRFSELLRCASPRGAERVVWERLKGLGRVETPDMLFGTIRHELWAQAALETGKPYHGFGLDWPVSHVEQEFATEILPGVVVHSRPDLVCAAANMLPDYKTVVDGVHGWRKTVDSYRGEAKQRQLRLYAFQLGMHNILIRQGAFLCEVWNKARNTIIGYEVVRFPITAYDMAGMLPWLRPRVAMLQTMLEEYYARERSMR